MREFNLNGTIVSNDEAWIYDWLEMDHACPAYVSQFLEDANGEDVLININSGGGDLFSGINIHGMLMKYPGNVTVHILGLAASAASIVAMAGKCYMTPGSMLMIHNVSCNDTGDKNGKAKMAKTLSALDKGVAAAYEQKSGMTQDELLRLMDKETWFDAKTALELRLIDGVLGDEVPRVAAAFGSGLLSHEAVETLKQLRLEKKTAEATGVTEATDVTATTVETTKAETTKAEASGVPVSQLKKRLSLLRR